MWLLGRGYNSLPTEHWRKRSGVERREKERTEEGMESSGEEKRIEERAVGRKRG